jgi:hypothetical protein
MNSLASSTATSTSTRAVCTGSIQSLLDAMMHMRMFRITSMLATT